MEFDAGGEVAEQVAAGIGCGRDADLVASGVASEYFKQLVDALDAVDLAFRLFRG